MVCLQSSSGSMDAGAGDFSKEVSIFGVTRLVTDVNQLEPQLDGLEQFFVHTLG